MAAINGMIVIYWLFNAIKIIDVLTVVVYLNNKDNND